MYPNFKIARCRVEVKLFPSVNIKNVIVSSDDVEM